MECTHQQVTAKRTPFFLNHKLTNSDTIREGSHRVHHPLCTYLSPLLLDKNALHSDREVPLQPFRKIKYLGKEKLSNPSVKSGGRVGNRLGEQEVLGEQ